MITPAAMPAELAPFAKRWDLAAYPGGLDVYSAERREDDGSMRYIVARTPAELAAKLAEAEAEAEAEAGQ
jgi:hypothetical protein